MLSISITRRLFIVVTSLIVLSGCASQSNQVDELESRLRASDRALQACQARHEDMQTRVDRAEQRAEEFRLRNQELERRMARMEARMSGKR